MQTELADLLDLFSQTLAKVTLSEFYAGRIEDQAFEILAHLGQAELALSLIEQISWQKRQTEIRERVKAIAQNPDQVIKVRPKPTNSQDVAASPAQLPETVIQARKLISRTERVDTLRGIARSLAASGAAALAVTVLLEEALPVALRHDHPSRRNLLLTEVANELLQLGESKAAWSVLKEILAEIAKPDYDEWYCGVLSKWYYEVLTALAVALTKAGQIDLALEIIAPLKSLGQPPSKYAKASSAIINILQAAGQQAAVVIKLQEELDDLSLAVLAIPYDRRNPGEIPNKYLELTRAIASGAALSGQATRAASLVKHTVTSKFPEENQNFRLVLELCWVAESLILAGFLTEAHALFEELVALHQAKILQIKAEPIHPSNIEWVEVAQAEAAIQIILLALALPKPIEQILAMARQIEPYYYRIRALRVVAGYLAEQGQPEQANQILAEAQTIFASKDLSKELIETHFGSRHMVYAKAAIKEGGLARTWDRDPWQKTIYSEERLYRTGQVGAILGEIRSHSQNNLELDSQARQQLLEIVRAKCIAATSWVEAFQIVMLTQPLIETEPAFGWQLYQMFNQVTKMPAEYLFKLMGWPEQLNNESA